MAKIVFKSLIGVKKIIGLRLGLKIEELVHQVISTWRRLHQKFKLSLAGFKESNLQLEYVGHL